MWQLEFVVSRNAESDVTVKREYPPGEWEPLDDRPFDFVERPDGSEQAITLHFLPTDDQEQRKWSFAPLGALEVREIICPISWVLCTCFKNTSAQLM